MIIKKKKYKIVNSENQLNKYEVTPELESYNDSCIDTIDSDDCVCDHCYNLSLMNQSDAGQLKTSKQNERTKLSVITPSVSLKQSNGGISHPKIDLLHDKQGYDRIHNEPIKITTKVFESK